MRFYKVFDRTEAKLTLAGTLDEAKAQVNTSDAVFRAQVVVTECELPNAKDNMLAFMNALIQLQSGDVQAIAGMVEMRRWHGTQRGGLKLEGEAKPEAAAAPAPEPDAPPVSVEESRAAADTFWATLEKK